MINHLQLLRCDIGFADRRQSPVYLRYRLPDTQITMLRISLCIPQNYANAHAIDFIYSFTPFATTHLFLLVTFVTFRLLIRVFRPSRKLVLDTNELAGEGGDCERFNLLCGDGGSTPARS